MSSVFDQTLFNWLLGMTGVAFGAILTALWAAIKDLQTADKQLLEKVAAIEVLVAGKYVTREELSRLTTALFTKLDRIEDKQDRKVNGSSASVGG